MSVFLWDDANTDHIARHGLELEDVEEALLDPEGVSAPAYNSGSEKRSGFIGATEAGRVLFVVYTYWDDDIRVVSAYDANASQKRRYRR